MTLPGVISSVPEVFTVQRPDSSLPLLKQHSESKVGNCDDVYYLITKSSPIQLIKDVISREVLVYYG